MKRGPSSTGVFSSESPYSSGGSVCADTNVEIVELGTGADESDTGGDESDTDDIIEAVDDTSEYSTDSSSDDDEPPPSTTIETAPKSITLTDAEAYFISAPTQSRSGRRIRAREVMDL